MEEAATSAPELYEAFMRYIALQVCMTSGATCAQARLVPFGAR